MSPLLARSDKGLTVGSKEGCPRTSHFSFLLCLGMRRRRGAAISKSGVRLPVHFCRLRELIGRGIHEEMPLAVEMEVDEGYAPEII